MGGQGYNLIQANTGLQPVFSTTTQANFNPTISFNDDYLDYIPATGTEIIDRATGALYAAGYFDVVEQCGFFGFDASNDFPGLHDYPVGGDYNLLIFTNGGPGYQGLSPNSFASQSYFISGATWENGGGNPGATYLGATVSLNGVDATYSADEMYNVDLNDAYDDMRVGWDSNWGSLNGELNELIVFENTLTAAEMNRVESYLAIKYGTTLADVSDNYTSSTGTVVWDRSINAAYNNNIAGIARDDGSALYQKQSWSENAGQQVLIGVGGLANTNASNTGTLTDGQFLIWGDNGLEKTPSVQITGLATINRRFAAIWKVQNTGGVGQVRIAWPARYTSMSLIQSSDDVFNAADNVTDMSSNLITINGVTYNYADVTLSDGSYFTFGVLANSPGGIGPLPAVWYRPENASTSGWTDASLNKLDLQSENTPSDGVEVNNGDIPHNFNKWTTSFSASSYYNYPHPNYPNDPNPVFGNYNTDLPDRYMYTPLSIFGAARVTNAADGSGQITGIDNEWDNGGEPGLGVNVNHPWTVRFSYGGINNYANTITSTENQTGVYSYILPAGPKDATGTADLIMALDGRDTTIAGVNPVGSVAGPYIKIGNSDYAFGPFPGDIQEVIWYKDSLSTLERQKVETYLALKYGSTLAHNYVDPTGNVVYSLTTNAGFTNNIAGIAHDENNGGLNQKQSNSVNVSDQQVLISTTGLANTNASNSVSLNDGQYLIWGDNGRARSMDSTIAGISGINVRMAAVWKVQNTGGVGTVRVAWPKGVSNLSLIQSTDTIFNSSDVATSMIGNEITIDNVVFNYVDVSLADGEYFTFGAALKAPGGVFAGLMMWHRADDGTTGGHQNTWKDISGNNRDVTQMNDTLYEPNLVLDGLDTVSSRVYFFNFNPFYYFDGGDFFYRDNDMYFPSRQSAGSLFSVSFNSTVGGWNTITGWSDDDPNLVRDGEFLQSWVDNGAPINENVGATSLNANIAGIIWKANGGDSIYMNVNGKLYNSPSSVSSLNDSDNFAIGSEGFDLTGNGNELFTGGIAEVFAYSVDYKNSPGDELLRINSYLAVKYGITLKTQDGSQTSDYLNSSSTVIWDASANSGYNENVAGIIHDVISGLNQKQSVSENAGKQVIIGTTGLGESNTANSVSLSNGQSLLWGDNGDARAPSVFMGQASNGINVHFAAIWKVDNTGNVGTVRVAWPAGLPNLTLIQSSDATFDGSDVFTAMYMNTITINGVDYNYADVSFSDGQYFTFGGKIEHAPGGVFHGLSLWFRADKNVSNTGNGTDITDWMDFAWGKVADNISTSPVPSFKTGSSDYLNFNPGVNYTANNQKLGNIHVQTLSSLKYDVFTATEEGGGNGALFNVGMDNTTLNGTNWDQPTIWGPVGTGTVTRRTNTGAGSYFASTAPAYFGNSPNIAYYDFHDTYFRKEMNGSSSTTKHTHNAVGLSRGGYIIGANSGPGSQGDDDGFAGNIGDIIVYGADTITQVERTRVETYLAIKYGVTLNSTSDYLASDSTKIWDKNNDTGFYHNVAGIGRDDISALNQKQSKSQVNDNPNDQVAIGIDSIYTTNLDNSGSIASDISYLVWGDNGETVAMTNTASTYVKFTYNGVSTNRHMTRVWKARNTGVNNKVLIRFPVASVGTTTLPNETGNCAEYVIVYASDSAMTQNIVAAPLTTETINGTDYYQVKHIFPQDASYFTFGKVSPCIDTLIADSDSFENYTQGDVTPTILGNDLLNNIPVESNEVTIATVGTWPSEITLNPDGTLAIGAAAADGQYSLQYEICEVGASPSQCDTATILLSINGPLPISLLKFNADVRSCKVILTWTTASEVNNDYFEIQRSYDTESWTTIDRIDGHAFSHSINTYSLIDEDVKNGLVYYRLLQVDRDGMRKYYNTVSLFVDDCVASNGKKDFVKIYPNPANDILNIELQDVINSDEVQITLMDASGRIVRNWRTSSSGGRKIQLNDLASGIYYIQFTLEDASTIIKKVIIME